MGNNLCQWLIISIVHVCSVHHRCKKKNVVGWGEIDGEGVECACVGGWVGGRILGRKRQIKMQQQQDVDK